MTILSLFMSQASVHGVGGVRLVISDFPDAPWYRLTVIDKTGFQHNVFGPKVMLWPFFETWRDKNWIDDKPLSIDGVCDSCDRAPLHFAIDPECISAVHLNLYS